MTVYTAAALGGRRYCNRCGEGIEPGDAIRLTNRAGRVIGHLCSGCAREVLTRTDDDRYHRDESDHYAAEAWLARVDRPPP